MSRHPELYQWLGTVVLGFPSLASHKLWVWRCGVLAGSFPLVQFNRCGRCVGALMGQSYNTLRERLRDTYREADAKAGAQRVELEVTECWAPWLAWLLAGGSGQQIAIAMDATS